MSSNEAVGNLLAEQLAVMMLHQKEQKEQLAAMTLQQKEQHAALQSSLQGNLSPITPSTLGGLTCQRLLKAGAWHNVADLLTDNTSPVMSAEVFADFEAAIEKDIAAPGVQPESVFVKHLTPVIGALLKKAAPGVMLVNTERHAWIFDPHWQPDLKHDGKFKPDFVGLHAMAFMKNKTHADVKHDGKHNNDESFAFGEIAHFGLRDLVQFIAECKTRLGDSCVGLGEAMQCVQRVTARFPRTRTAPEDHECLAHTKAIVAGADGFQLLTCTEQVAVRCTAGKWTDAGGESAILKFLAPKPNTWVEAFEQACTAFDVRLPDINLESDTGNSVPHSFLGRGAYCVHDVLCA